MNGIRTELRCFLLAVLLMCSCAALSAQKNEGSAVLVPVEVFVGDNAQIVYTQLSAGADFAAVPISVPPSFDGLQSICTVDSAAVSRKNGKRYIIISFIPWAAGPLDLPPFSAVFTANGIDEKIHVDIPAVSIQSILTKIENPSLRPPRSPLIVPGTTYVLYAAVFLICLLICAAVYAAVQYRSGGSVQFYKRLLLSKNYRKARRQLRKLRSQHKRLDSAVFAYRLDRILRRYFSVKIDEKFTSASSGEMSSLINAAYCHCAGSVFDQAAHDVVLLFIRLDFVRYADSKYPETVMTIEEKLSITDNVLRIISLFDKGDFA